jgi:serine protease Do
MQVAARLMSVERVGGVWHGVVPRDAVRDGRSVVLVDEVQADSPAAASGIRQGDVIQSVAGQTVRRALDVERALLDATPGQAVRFAVERAHRAVEVDLAVADAPRNKQTVDDKAWDDLGLRLTVVDQEDIQRYSDRFRGGLKVTAVRGDGPAARQGMRQGDILVGMHTWETISLENLAYILTQSDLGDSEAVQFFILRGDQTLAGNLPVSWTR